MFPSVALLLPGRKYAVGMAFYLSCTWFEPEFNPCLNFLLDEYLPII
jgi:hypothetical protein